MQVLLDTDVILDVLLARQPFVQDSRKMWDACARNQLTGYISGITPVNVFYILRKIIGSERARSAVVDLCMLFSVCPVDRAVLQGACVLPMSDFEDAVQASAAQFAGLDAIVTRNSADYTSAPLPVLTPAEAILRLLTP